MARILNLWVLLVFVCSSQSFAENPFVLEEATVDSVHAAIEQHALTCEQLVKHYISRIKQGNLNATQAAPINAITEINPYVIEEARALDADYAKTKVLKGPLHCAPVLIKDNIGAFDSSMTSGSLALLGNQPVQDAYLVAAMRKAGAIILAHTAMDEFAWGAVGVSSRSGRTGNAYDPTQNPGGSSGGTAAGISANFGLVGIGTDNSGSVRIPAAFNGLYGLRPSRGLVSQKGIFPMGNLDGVPGPMTRTVKDLVLVLDAMTALDPSDSASKQIPHVKTYTTYLKQNGLQGKRIGIVHSVGQYDTFKGMPKDIQTILKASQEKMQQLGATFVDNIHLPKFDNDRKNNMAGMVEDLNAYLASYPAARKNFQDICESDRTRNFGDTRQCMAFMKSNLKKSSAEYQNVLKMFQKNKNYIEKFMNENHLDALMLPISKQGIATYNMDAINTFQGALSSNAGLPSIAMTIGYKGRMPIGIELVGRQFDEGILIEMAYAYEQHTPARIVPLMSQPNEAFQDYTIADLNHLYTLIGYDAYQKVLQDKKKSEESYQLLTAQKFQKIVMRRLHEFSVEKEGHAE